MVGAGVEVRGGGRGGAGGGVGGVMEKMLIWQVDLGLDAWQL